MKYNRFWKKICILLTVTALFISSNVTGYDVHNTQKEILDIDPEIIDMINQIDEEILSYYLEKFVSFGAKDAGSENADKTANWIKSEFEEIGLNTYFQDLKFPIKKDKNVIAVHNGIDETSNAVILICAHYDTIGNSPGAIDDGTGIAAMLTIANITKDSSFNHTIRFIATAAEECGTYGSFADAKKTYENDENILAVLNIDCIGFDKTSENNNIVQLVGTERTYWLVDFIKQTSNKYSPLFNVIPQYCGNFPADHESYKDYGYDALMFIQTKPEDCDRVIFHTPNDTIDKVDFLYLEKITKLILATACELAINPIDIQVRILTPREGCIYIHDNPIKLPCFNIYITRIRALTYIVGKTTVKINVTTNDEINSVYFGLDGYLQHIDNEEPYEYIIGVGEYSFFRGKGHHRLTISVTTNTGKVGFDEMDIFIVKLI